MHCFRRAARTFGLTALLLSACAAPLAAACNGDDDKNDSGSTSSSVSTGTPSGTTASGTAAATPPPIRDITVTAANFSFDPATIEVFANQQVALTLQNKDAPGEGDPVRHSFHLLNIKDTNGVEPGSALIPPGTLTTINFTIAQPGTYDFQCDVHPDRMKGKLTVR